MARFVIRAIAVSASLFAGSEGLGEVTIDDFTIPQAFDFPEQPGAGRAFLDSPIPVRTLGVAFRTVAFRESEVTGSVTVNEGPDQGLVGRIDSYPAVPDGEFAPGVFFISLRPLHIDEGGGFVPVDWSEGGVNDTVFVDFERLVAPKSLNGVEVVLRVEGGSYLSRVPDVAPSDEPFRLAFHVDTFSPYRGNGAQPGPYIDRLLGVDINVHLRGVFEADPVERDFEFEISRLWIGRSVPEPSSAVLLLLAVLGGRPDRRIGAR